MAHPSLDTYRGPDSKAHSFLAVLAFYSPNKIKIVTDTHNQTTLNCRSYTTLSYLGAHPFFARAAEEYFFGGSHELLLTTRSTTNKKFRMTFATRAAHHSPAVWNRCRVLFGVFQMFQLDFFHSYRSTLSKLFVFAVRDFRFMSIRVNIWKQHHEEDCHSSERKLTPIIPCKHKCTFLWLIKYKRFWRMKKISNTHCQYLYAESRGRPRYYEGYYFQ